MDLSIIIPVYNTPSSILERCLNSILKIENIDYEIIIVNDGTGEEKSIDYKSLIGNYNSDRIKYIVKENGGVSSARNMGIRESIGKYIMFVDSDDTIIGKNLLLKKFNYKADIVIFDMNIVKENTKIRKKELEEPEGIICEESIIFDAYFKNKSFYGPCAKLYKKDFLEKNKIEFDEKMIQGEDANFNLECFLHNPQIYYTNTILYDYYYDHNTTDNRWIKFPIKMAENLLKRYNTECETLKDSKNQKTYRRIINNKYIDEIFRAYLIVIKSKEISREIKKETLTILKKILNKLDTDEIDKNKKIKIRILKKENWNCIKILSMVRNLYLAIKEKKKG